MSSSPIASDAPDDTEAALWLAFRSQGSRTAREKLFMRHAAFARNIARRHHHERSRGDIDMNDLQQLAYTGLLEALDRFDPEQGIPFRPFAAHRISGSIRDGIVRMSETREQMSWHHRARRERMKSVSEGAAASQEPIERLTEIVIGLALGFMLEGTGLFLHEEGARADLNAVPRTAYDSLAWNEMILRLKLELTTLPERERNIVKRHYMEGMSFEELSSLLGISKGRVSQLHHAALARLRRRMGENGHTRIGNITR